MYSKYERRTDTRTYEDRKKLYEGVNIQSGFIKETLSLHSLGLGDSILRIVRKRLEGEN